MRDKSVSGSGPRMLELMKLIAKGPRDFTLSELASRAGLAPSSTHRLLQVLVRAGIVERGHHQRYHAGREFFLMAADLRAQFDLRRLARPYLQQLWSQWNETTALCLYSPSSNKGVIADVKMTNHPLRFAVEIGMEIELPWGSLGKAILAHLTENTVDEVLNSVTVGPISNRHLPSRDEIFAELAVIRAAGFAQYFDLNYDVAGTASAVFDKNGSVLGCIGITMPSQRLKIHNLEEMSLSVAAVGKSLSADIALKS